MSREKFEVDEDLCIGCGLCEERAPENMEVPATLMHARVAKQPTTDEEEEACIEAAEYCPTTGLRRVSNEEAAAAGRPDESSLVSEPVGGTRMMGRGGTQGISLVACLEAEP